MMSRKPSQRLDDAATLLRSGAPEKARGLLLRYCRTHKTDVGGWFMLGIAHGQLGEDGRAAACFEKIIRLNPAHAGALYNLGKTYLMRDAYDMAIRYFEQAVAIDPGMYEAYFDMGNAYRVQGRKDEAELSFRRALHARPDYPAAYFALSHTKKYQEADADVQSMERLLNKPGLSMENRLFILFGLSKIYDDLKEYDKAFSMLEMGNRLKRQSYDYNSKEHELLFARIESVFTEGFFSQRSDYGVSSDKPVFIIGMPRSGTTLVEQILSCHPSVYGAGELLDLNRIVFGLNEKLSAITFPENAVSLDKDDIQALARLYLECLDRYSSEKAYVVDKNPSNFILVGMIRLMFPHARIIHCLRDPVDTCFSIYQQLFSSTKKYAYDLVELGNYYRLYRRLMRHWHQVLPGAVLEVCYEDLVANQETETRRLLEFCGLSWDDQCLTFHASGRAVKTASVEQVRQPIYRSSIRKWRHYEAHLGPLLGALGVDLDEK